MDRTLLIPGKDLIHMNPLEIEVKFFVADLQPIRDRLLEFGAQSRGRFFETNVRFEDSEKNLIKKNALLRLRKDNRVTLTYKSNPGVGDDNFKIYHELEVEVNDFKTMESILNSLGFCAVQVYEKWRETMVLNNTQICLDTMPFGNFLEIEGSRENIMAMAKKLSLDWEKRILFNYLKMFEMIKVQENLNFSDVTFENFKQIFLNISNYISDFYVKA
jgi:adenylate cyclase class 2